MKFDPTKLNAESRRDIGSVLWTGRTEQLDVPLDTTIKRFHFRLSGYWANTYASGSPVADDAGFSGRIMDRVELVVDGNETIKSVNPYMLQKQQQLLWGIMGERAYTKDIVGVPTTLIGGTETASGAPFVYSATTKYTIINESFVMYCEHVHAYEDGRRQTLLHTKGLSSAVLKFSFNGLDNLQRAESSPVSMTFGSDTSLTWVVSIVENKAIVEDEAEPFLYFREIQKQWNTKSAGAGQIERVQKGGWLTGIHFLVRDGDANKSLSDTALKSLKLIADGDRHLAAYKFIGLQAENRARYGIQAARASGKTSMQGYAYLNLMEGGSIFSGVPTPSLQSLDLEFETAASSGTDAATYTNPVTVDIMTQDVVMKPRKNRR